MKLVSEFRQYDLADGLVRSIRQYAQKPARFMEFCGGHTVSIMKSGLRQLLPPSLTLTSGPGCPVCVTDNADLDKAIELGHEYAMSYNSRGYAHVNNQQLDQAIEDFSKAIELNPNHTFAYFNRGIVYKSQQQYDLAVVDFRKSIELSDNPDLIKIAEQHIDEIASK